MRRSLLGLVLVAQASWLGCSEEITGPTPAVEDVSEPLVCNEQLTTTIDLSGAELSPLALDAATGDPLLAIPDITLTRTKDLDGTAVTADPIELPNDPEDPAAARVSWTSAMSMSFDIYPELALDPGIYDVTVTNRNGHSATLEVAIAAVARPSITSVDPLLICNEQNDREISITGSSFVVLRDDAGDTYPTVTVGGEEIPVVSASGCIAIAQPDVDAEVCDALMATIPTTLTLLGDQDVVVTNPEPANCSSQDSAVVHLIAPPVIDSIEPKALCDTTQPSTMTVRGSGFLRIDNGSGGFTDPVVSVDTVPVTVTFDAGDCTPLVSDIVTGEVCTAFTMDVPQPSGFGLGDHTLVIANPDPAGCSDTIQFAVGSTPTITDLVAAKVCSEGDTFTVIGTGFIDGAEIVVDGTPIATTFTSSTELVGEIPPGFVAGAHPVTVSIAGSCESDPYDSLIVEDAPIVFYVDPPNIYNGVDFRITVWASGLKGTSPQITLRQTGTTNTFELANEVKTNTRVQGELTAGLAPGSYDVIVHDEPCDTEAIGVLTITDALTLTVSSIAPEFGVEGERTGVSVFSTPGDFQQTPRIYLNPVGGGAATEVQSIQWTGDPSRLEGVIPALPPGDYQVFVVNPDGAVGELMGQTFRVLASDNPPPEITELTPGQVINATNQSVAILGNDFPTDLANLAVQATCRDRNSNETVVVPGTITPVSATEVDTIWDLSGLANETICVVRLTNTAAGNGAFSDFSALSVVNSSGNLANFYATGIDMNQGRRALAGAAIRMNSQSRYVFAIGGDDGAATPVRTDTVEAVPLDPFGTITAGWSYQRNALPEPRAFFQSAVAGRYVYIAGGRIDGMTAAGDVDDQVLRAYLLDPAEAPVIDDLDLFDGDGTDPGLGAGLWSYRVAAVMDAGDPNNPGGESLASEPLVVRLPSLTNNAFLTLHWNHVAGAVSYRIYRTETVDGVAGTEVLLAEMPTMVDMSDVPLERQEFADHGTDTPDTAQTPMPLGSTGIWHSVGTLNTAREGAGIVVVPDPIDPTSYYLYVMGGRDSGGTALDSYERIEITASASSSQTLDGGGFVEVTGALTGGMGSGGRWNIGAVYMDAKKSTQIKAISDGPNDPTVYVYALAGVDGGGSTIAHTTAFLVDVADGVADADMVDGDGSLGTGSDENAPNNQFSGYGYVANHNYIHVMGGANSAPSTGGKEAFVDTTPPALSNWNAGTGLVPSTGGQYGGRYLCGVARESAFVFLLGGETPNSPAEETVEQTNF